MLLNIGLKLCKCRALIYHLFSQEVTTPTGDLVVRFLFVRVFKLESRNKNVEQQTNGQKMDI